MSQQLLLLPTVAMYGRVAVNMTQSYKRTRHTQSDASRVPDIDFKYRQTFLSVQQIVNMYDSIVSDGLAVCQTASAPAVLPSLRS